MPLKVRPYDIGVSVACPPDTDTPGLEEENKDKVIEVWNRVSLTLGFVFT